MGVGLTVIVKFCGVPAQPFAKGVTVMVATIGVELAFVAVKAGIVPTPVAASPIEGCELVQLKVVPPTNPVKIAGLVNDPLHRV